jgi:hypothetical protein
MESAPEKKPRKLSVRLRWLFGLVNVGLSGGTPRQKKSHTERKTRRVRQFTFGRVERALLTRGLFAGIARFLRRILRAVKVRDFRLHVRFGFDDPADTGMLVAAAEPALWVLRTWGAERFFVEPDFDQEIALADGNVDVRIYPLHVITASAMFLLSPPTLRAAKALLR